MNRVQPGGAPQPAEVGWAPAGLMRAAPSTTHDALRCRAVGMWASKHATEQNRSLIRPALQADTEQRYRGLWPSMRLLHVAHTAVGVGASIIDTRFNDPLYTGARAGANFCTSQKPRDNV